MDKDNAKRPIGVFDSGMGGISVLAELMEWMPNERFIYFGDTKNAPYGVKSKKEVRDLAIDACSYLTERGAKAIVVACNTATSAAIRDLRKMFPIPVVGMEPALKVAVDKNPKGRILVAATPMTLKENKFAELVDRFSSSFEIERIPAPELVEMVEMGILDGDEAEEALRGCFGDLDSKAVSSIVLGCTHFVFLDEAIRRIYGGIDVIDGNQGTARHIMNLLMGRNMLNQEIVDEVEIELCTSSEDAEVIESFKRLLKVRAEHILNKKRIAETEKELEKRILGEIYDILKRGTGFTEIEKKLIAHRYGVNKEKITDAGRLSRELNLPKAKIVANMEKAERKLFNLIKERI